MEQILSITLGYIAKQHGISEDAAAELLFESSEGKVDKTKLKDGALNALLSLDQDRVTKLKESVDTTEVFTQGYNKARNEVLEKAERKFAKKYGIEDESLKLDKLVEAIVAKSAPEGDQLGEDKIKTHPLFLELERSKATELANLTQTYDEKIKGLETSYAKKETMRTVSTDILEFFDGLNPVLSSDSTRANNQRNSFAEKFNGYDFEAQEDGSYLILIDGKRVEDGHGHPQSLKALVEQEASRYYDFKVQGKKEGTGNGESSGDSGAGAIEVPDSEAAFNKAIFEASTSEERAALTEAYSAAQGS